MAEIQTDTLPKSHKAGRFSSIVREGAWAIIETLFRRQFLARQGKHVHSAPAGRALIDTFPEPVKDPTTTAVWEQTLEAIGGAKEPSSPFSPSRPPGSSGLSRRSRSGHG